MKSRKKKNNNVSSLVERAVAHFFAPSITLVTQKIIKK
jgi:hypothetical protein